DDQDRAERFYTEVLGLQLKTNAAYGPGERWLTVVSPEEPDGVELVLHLTDEPARAFRRGRPRAGSRPGCPTAAWTRSSTTPAATSSTSTRTEGGSEMATADGSWVLWTVAGIVGVWVAVTLISLLAPDMVTGSEQQHLAVAAFGTWVWGLVAPGAV